MAVTTRDYNLTTSRPKDIIQAMHDAITDLGWFETQPLGYLCNFVNTPGSTIANRANERYLVTAASTTAPAGTEAVFDILRSPTGAISAVTLVTGGSGYYIRGQINVSTSGTTMTVPDTTGINPGMVVTRIAGTGALQTNTVVVSVTNSTTLVIDQTPTTPLSGATVSFADTLTISGDSIGGSTYTMSATGTSGQTTITVSSSANIFVGQVVTGTGIGSLVTVSSISNNVITLSKANVGTVTGNVTFSDGIIVTVTGNANTNDISGTASGLTITNVASNANIYVGGTVEIQSGPTWDAGNGRVMIASISGSGPYTITLRNEENTFKGFTSSGNIVFRVASGSDVNWFEVDSITAPQTYVWAVAKIKNANAGKLRNTFWLFYAGYSTTLNNGITLLARPLTGFNPLTNSAQGVSGLDWLGANAAATTVTAMHLNIIVASSAYVSTMLRVRQSGIDPDFATFSFFEGNNNRNPFFIPKYNTNYQPWTLDDVFLGGITEVFQNPTFNTSDAGILFRTRMNAPKRMAETGYGNYNLAVAPAYSNTLYRSVTGNRPLATPSAVYDDVALYSRQTGDIQTSVTTTYPIYTGISVNPHFLPTPYYLPNDFVLIELPWINPAVRDTVTVNAGEVYTIVQTATNQTSFTAIVLAARTT